MLQAENGNHSRQFWSHVAHLQTSLGSGCRVALPRLDWHNLDDVQENQFPLKFVEEVEVR